MNRGELVLLISQYAKKYCLGGVLESVSRNHHMNKYSGELVSKETIDAIIVDFVNFIGMQQGIDLAMYTDDLET